MTLSLHDYCEQEGISKDDIINSEIEQEHKEAEKKTDFQSDVDAWIEEIKTSQAKKHQYFKEVLQGKHPGKKLVQQRIEIEFAEVIDYDKTQLVFEETEEDTAKNRKYFENCSVKVDKAALQFANELQKHEKFCIEAFNLAFRVAEISSKPEIKIQAMDLKTGKIQNLNEVPKGIRKQMAAALAGCVSELGEGEEKEEGTEAETV